MNRTLLPVAVAFGLSAVGGCAKHPPLTPVAPELAAATWFDVEPGKPMCVSSMPDAPRLADKDRTALALAVTAIANGAPDEARAGMAALPDHPAVAHAAAVLGILTGDPTAATTLLALAAEHPQDACALAMGAMASATLDDADGAMRLLTSARQAAPNDGAIAFLSWWLGLEDNAVVMPVLDAALAAATDPSVPGYAGLALAVGLERLSNGDESALHLLEVAVDAGMAEAVGVLLLAYRDLGRHPEYLVLASKAGLLADDGSVAQAADPQVAYDALIGRGAGEALTATFDTSLGAFTCRLLPDVAPVAVANFVGWARGTAPWLDPRDGTERTTPLYAGTSFHRVIPEFMIQGGDPLGTGAGGPGFRYLDEVDADVTFDRPGRLALANNGPNANGSQFFVTEVAVPRLDGRHTIFGECDEAAVKRVAQIARVPRDPDDRPLEPVILNQIAIASAVAPAPVAPAAP